METYPTFASVFFAKAKEGKGKGLASRRVRSFPRAGGKGSPCLPAPWSEGRAGVGVAGVAVGPWLASSAAGRLIGSRVGRGVGRVGLRSGMRAGSRQPLAGLGVFPPCQGGSGQRPRRTCLRARARTRAWTHARRCAHAHAQLGAHAPAPPPTPPRAARIFTLPPLEKICVFGKLSPTTCSLVFRPSEGIVLAG